MKLNRFNSIRRLRRFILILIANVLFTTLANAFVTLQWDANQEPNISGYKVHIGVQSGDYTTTIDAGPATQQVIQSLEPGRTYHFAITAYDSDGLESGFSDEVTYTPLIDGTNACIVPIRMTFAAPAAVTINFACDSEHSYFVQATEDFQNWQTVHAVTPTVGGTNQWVDADAFNHAKRFYRVIGSRP